MDVLTVSISIFEHLLILCLESFKLPSNIFPTFATEAESNLQTFPELCSLTFNDLETVSAATILQFVRLVERVRRTISHEYGVPLSTILPLQAYSRKYVAGTTQQGGGGGHPRGEGHGRFGLLQLGHAPLELLDPLVFLLDECIMLGLLAPQLLELLSVLEELLFELNSLPAKEAIYTEAF